MDKQKTGEFLKLARQRKGFTQKQLAELLFVSDKAVSRWETANSFPDVTLLTHLADTLNVCVSDILRGESTPPSAENETVLTEVLGEVQVQQDRLKKRLKALLTCFILVVLTLVVGVLVTVIGLFYVVGAEKNVQEAQLTLAFVLFACCILFVTIVLPLLVICLAWRVRMGAHSKIIRLFCAAVMVGTALLFVFYWFRVLLSIL